MKISLFDYYGSFADLNRARAELYCSAEGQFNTEMTLCCGLMPARIYGMGPDEKGQPMVFAMKAQIGADRDSKLVHTVVVTAANVADITKTAELLHGQEKQVHADAAYTGVEKCAEIVALARRIDWQIAGKRGQIKSMVEGAERNPQGHRESQSLGESVRRTPLPHSEECIPASESAVSRTGQEWASTLHPLSTGQRGDRRTNSHDMTKP